MHSETSGAVDPIQGTLLGRPLSAQETLRAASMPLEALSAHRPVLKSLSEKGVRTVGELAASPLGALELGPVQSRRLRQALLLVLADDAFPARLEAADLSRLPDVVRDLLGFIEERRRSVVERTYGLWDGHPVERTRIAQTLSLSPLTVESDLDRASADLRKLLHPESDAFKKALRSIYVKLLAAPQGMAAFHEWQDARSPLFRRQESAALAFAFLCRVTQAKPELLVSVGLEGVCYESVSTKYRRDQVVDAAKTALLNTARPMTLDELRERLKRKDRLETTTDFLRRCIELSRELGIERSGAVGLRNWSYFDADSLHAMAHAALAAIGRPAHHEKIAAKVDELYPHRAPVNRVSLHSMLAIHKEEFVLARHGGVFGLPEWEERAVTSLKDFLIDFLRENGGKATRQALLAAASEKGYKPSSVSTILHMNKDLFRHVKRGEWGLAA